MSETKHADVLYLELFLVKGWVELSWLVFALPSWLVFNTCAQNKNVQVELISPEVPLHNIITHSLARPPTQMKIYYIT